MGPLGNVWSRLDADGEAQSGFVRLRLPDVRACDLFAAKSIGDGLEALVIEIATSSITHMSRLPDAQGLQLSVYPLSPGREGRTRIVAAVSNAEFRDVFRLFADDIHRTLANAPHQVAATRGFIDRIHRWQRFLGHRGHNGLTKEEQLGLIGELTFLRDSVMPRMSSAEAVASWKGSSRAIHDFAFCRGTVEVKALGSSEAYAFGVSNIDQLDSAAPGEHFICCMSFERTSAGPLALNNVVDEIRYALSDGAEALFNDCLLDAGYVDAHRDRYSDAKYALRSTRYFHVVDGFPRIRRSSLASGVEGVSYRVNIAACSPYQVADAFVWQHLVTAVETT